MATTNDFVCPICDDELRDKLCSLTTKPVYLCPSCGALMRVTYRYRQGIAPCVNFGWRESRYGNQTDSDIAKFQFEHL